MPPPRPTDASGPRTPRPAAPKGSLVPAQPARLSLRRDPDEGLVIELAGDWRAARDVPRSDEAFAALRTRPPRVRFDATALEGWNSTLVAVVTRLLRRADQSGVPADRSGLPAGVQRLLDLAAAAPGRTESQPEQRAPFLARVGAAAQRRAATALATLAFVGDTTIALARMAAGRARFRWRELFLLVQLAGAEALGIVSLVAFLVGLVFAFVSAVQLETFGAAIYVADLVGIAMVREMGALMAGIVASGRTGAAYAAELGTMRVNQEIDAFETLGISPMEFLVAPRVVALTIMLPVLCLYADLLGILGGAVVGVGMMGVGARVYYQETLEAVTTTHLVGGVLKAAVYGALVAAAGCFQGIHSGRTAAAVGHAATAAVVDGIVLVISACGLFAWVFYALGL